MGFSESSFSASAAETEKFMCDRLLDQNQPISERFRALFSLRNLHGFLPCNALIVGCLVVKGKHWVQLFLVMCLDLFNSLLLGYVSLNSIIQSRTRRLQLHFLCYLGLLMSIQGLDTKLLIRHKAAEALGSIADDQCVALLNEFAKDFEPLVSESCEVVLSMLRILQYFFMQAPQVDEVPS